MARNESLKPAVCLIVEISSRASLEPAVWGLLQKYVEFANVRKLPAVASSADEAKPYIASLIAQNCRLVIGIGNRMGQAIVDSAPHAPTVRFATIAPDPAGPGVIRLPSDEMGLDIRLSELIREIRNAVPATTPTGTLRDLGG